MKNLKKILAVILSILMVAAIPMTAFAAPRTGTPIGTEAEQRAFVDKALEHYMQEYYDTNEESWERWTRSTEDPIWQYWELADGTIRIMNVPEGTYPDGTIVEPYTIYNMTIPSTLDNKKVTEIRRVGANDLLSIIIPEGVTSIDYNTYANIANLQRIVIPTSVKSIEINAISNSGAELIDIYYCGTEEQWNDIVVWNAPTTLDSAWAVTDFNWLEKPYINTGVERVDELKSDFKAVYFNTDPSTLEDLVPKEEEYEPTIFEKLAVFFANIAEAISNFFARILSFISF